MRILQSSLTFRIAVVVIALTYLTIYWQRSNNGRYEFRGSVVMDTRTGEVTIVKVRR